MKSKKNCSSTAGSWRGSRKKREKRDKDPAGGDLGKEKDMFDKFGEFDSAEEINRAEMIGKLTKGIKGEAHQE